MEKVEHASLHGKSFIADARALANATKQFIRNNYDYDTHSTHMIVLNARVHAMCYYSDSSLWSFIDDVDLDPKI